MHFPKFWATEAEGPLRVWRWSDLSLDEARRNAADAVKRMAARISQKGFERAKGYEYGAQPLREEVLQELKDSHGDLIGAVTRNIYGAEVLNTARVMFLDIDLLSPRPSISGFVAKLFGKGTSASPEDEARERLSEWCKKNPQWGMNIYRTCAGLRVLVTHDLFEPSRLNGDPLWNELKVDPLYCKLCVAQNSFRARLTPKPWRCNWIIPRDRWPWLSGEHERRFQKWEQEYKKLHAGYATTKFLEHVGSPRILGDINGMIDLHDRVTKAREELPLA